MNRYPVWKYAIIVVALLVGILYTLPNLFGEAPAVQVSSAKATVKVDAAVLARVQAALDEAGVTTDLIGLEGTSVRARFDTPDTQLKAKDAIQKALILDAADPMYIVALNLVSRSPAWLTAIHAAPMYLGLDLRGGVHFMLQVDMQAALTKKAESYAGDIRTVLRDKNIRHGGISRNGQNIDIRVRDEAMQTAARNLIADEFADLQTTSVADGSEFKLIATIKPEALRRVQDQALKQNITTLHNRINELGVAEPVIQQQGLDRIVVQLAGVQDMARVQQIIGRIATLQTRMVDESLEGIAASMGEGNVPLGSERYLDGDKRVVIVKKDVIFSGDNLTDAWVDQDNNGQPAVGVSLDSIGAAAFKQATGENIGKRMAILLFEKGKGEVITAPTIQARLGERFIISGSMSSQEAADTALLLRAGSLAAPMEIIEERTIGPSLGAENIEAGFNSVLYGFIAVAIFMSLYYMLFGVFSTIALAFNLLMLVAVLSMMQATLTLPGMAAMALVLGMAIDANVLINERIREELRHGLPPQKAIAAGYDRAWSTIFDSNITTLIAGLALLAFGTGAVRGFAVVHTIGILTSMFSAVFFSRGLVNLWYGSKKKLASVSIGTVWRPEGGNQLARLEDSEDETAQA